MSTPCPIHENCVTSTDPEVALEAIERSLKGRLAVGNVEGIDMIIGAYNSIVDGSPAITHKDAFPIGYAQQQEGPTLMEPQEQAPARVSVSNLVASDVTTIAKEVAREVAIAVTRAIREDSGKYRIVYDKAGRMVGLDTGGEPEGPAFETEQLAGGGTAVRKAD